MYSIHEGIRGISLDPSDSTETLMPITGTLFAVGVDFHAGSLSNILHCLFMGGQHVFFMIVITAFSEKTSPWQVLFSVVDGET